MHNMSHKWVLPQILLYYFQQANKEQNVQVAQGLYPRLLLWSILLVVPSKDVRFDLRLLLFVVLPPLVYNCTVVQTDSLWFHRCLLLPETASAVIFSGIDKSRGIWYIPSMPVKKIPKYIQINNTFEPNPENRKIYDQLFAEFLNIYKHNKAIFKRLNAME